MRLYYYILMRLFATLIFWQHSLHAQTDFTSCMKGAPGRRQALLWHMHAGCYLEAVHTAVGGTLIDDNLLGYRRCTCKAEHWHI